MTLTPGRPEDLRAHMVAHIKNAGHARSERVARALRTVPRHVFVPAVTPEDAYANKAITIKPGAHRPTSCASVPIVVAMMLDQLDVQPGDHILEIGAGTGYNAALLAELVGHTGRVTTIDIDTDVTAHARSALASTGYHRVTVITRDGALGAAEHALYDKIIVTVGPWDLPSAWVTQLALGGTLVVPLHWRGQARSVAFTNEGGILCSGDSQLCGLIPMIGLVPAGETRGEISKDVSLYWERDQPIQPTTLQTVFTHPDVTLWSGVTVAPDEPFDGIWLRLTATDPATCRLAATQTAIDDGVCQPVFAQRNPALAESESLAYLTSRKTDAGEGRRYELGATGHGPTADTLAERICRQIKNWDRDRLAQPAITVYPARTPDDSLVPGLVIEKDNTRIVLTM